MNKGFCLCKSKVLSNKIKIVSEYSLSPKNSESNMLDSDNKNTNIFIV